MNAPLQAVKAFHCKYHNNNNLNLTMLQMYVCIATRDNVSDLTLEIENQVLITASIMIRRHTFGNRLNPSRAIHIFLYQHTFIGHINY